MTRSDVNGETERTAEMGVEMGVEIAIEIPRETRPTRWYFELDGWGSARGREERDAQSFELA